MLKHLGLSLLGMLLALMPAQSSLAETVMEKVARTGVLTTGIRFDLIPYSYVNDRGELDGYSLNLLNLVREEIERQLGKEITLQVVESQDIGDRISQLKSGEIDIACDTVFTWERDKQVDFSVSFSVSGIRLLVPKGSSLGSPESLKGQAIGVLSNTIADDTLKLVQPQAQLVPLSNYEEGITALKTGKIQALAGDSILLDGLRQTSEPDNYQLVPSEPYARYGVACMVPQDNSTFLNLVNYTLVKFMQGYLSGEKGPVEMLERWIGPQGIVTGVSPEAVREFFSYTLMTHEQIPPSESQNSGKRRSPLPPLERGEAKGKSQNF